MTKNNICLISLGCDKNRVDSEEMLGHLKGAGFSFTSDESEADIIIVNTCAFIDAAKEESIETILEMAEYKKTGNLKKLVVAGCLAERYKDEILKEFPEVDAVMGISDLSEIIRKIQYSGEPECVQSDDTTDAVSSNPDIKRVLTTGGHYEFLKISEGCSKFCTYCAIPYIRGKFRSFPMEELISEAEYLASEGVKELIIVAQDSTLYGVDLYGEKKLPELLHKLCVIDGIEWIRVLYCYPEEITDELLRTIADEEKICKYIDMPIQHASDPVLKKMGRRTDYAALTDVIERARQIIPDLIIRTTLISGFPGETDDDHKQNIEFIKKIKFNRLGVFAYSREEGTPAHDFPDQISEELKEIRREEIMAIQENISLKNHQDLIGRKLEAFIEGKLVDEDIYVARTRMDAPDVDGCFFVKADRELMSGDIVNAIVTEANAYDLIGEIVY